MTQPFDFPMSLTVPPVAEGQRYQTWQRFAVRAAPLSFLFSALLTAFLYALWQAVTFQSPFLYVLVTLFPLCGVSGLILSLDDARRKEDAYADTLIIIYQETQTTIQNYINNLQLIDIRAGKGSTVNVGTDMPAVDTPTPAEVRRKFILHLREFKQLIPVRGIQRERWLPPGGSPTQWSDGDSITRQEYDAICEALQTAGMVVERTRGKAGKTTPLLAEGEA